MRRILFDVAQKQWPELLSGLQMGSALYNTHGRQKHLEELFERFLMYDCGYNTGKAYNQATKPEDCINVTIMYRTFLQAKQ